MLPVVEAIESVSLPEDIIEQFNMSHGPQGYPELKH